MPTAGYHYDAYGTLLQITDRRNPYQRLLDATRGDHARHRRLAMTRDWSFAEFGAAIGAAPGIAAALEVDLTAELESIALIEGAALDQLRLQVARGDPVGVISNLAQPYAEAVRLLLPPFTAYVWSFSVNALKPEPSIFEHAAEALGLPPEQILMTGDCWRADIEGARAVGMGTCWVGA